jgi:predicted ATPase
MHTLGHAAPPTVAASEKARLLIEQAVAIGEPPEDPLQLYPALFGIFVANFVAFDGDAVRGHAEEFLALAEKQELVVPRMVGHRIVGISRLFSGAIPEALSHYDQAYNLYEPEKHRAFAIQFVHDPRVSVLVYRAWIQCMLGYPERAITDASQGLKEAREIGLAATLMYALICEAYPLMFCGQFAAANAVVDEILTAADEKKAPIWKAYGTLLRGSLLALGGRADEAIRVVNSGLALYRSIEGRLLIPLHLCHLARAYLNAGNFDEAQRSIGEAIATIRSTKELLREAEAHRVAGEIALGSPERDEAAAEACFQLALSVARRQQAKSWELRSATNLARLWQDQGRHSDARDLLVPVYNWLTEGFDTRDLKEAKALLDELAK